MSRSPSKPWRFAARGMFALCWASALLPAAADTIADAIDKSAGISDTVIGTTVSPVIDSGSALPAHFYVGNYSGQSELYGVEATLSGSFDYTLPGGDGDVGALIDIASSSGGIDLQSTAAIQFLAARASVANAIGDAAIRAVAQPIGVSGDSHEFGGAVNVQQSGDITVAGNGARNPSGTPLTPEGRRMADLSGILALSYGKQGSGLDTAHLAGAVGVAFEYSQITMSQTDSSILTAGISAAAANGAGGDFVTTSEQPFTVQVGLTHGIITNTADSGVGVMATSSGGRLVEGGGSIALGNDAHVELHDESSISATGATGIGIFATSVIYMPGEAGMGTPSQAGDVSVVLDDLGSSITAGNASSKFSIGVLAVSAGTAAFLDPYATHESKSGGVGHAGEATITNFGTVKTYGQASAGLVALSLGGPAIVTTNASGENTYLGIDGGGADGNGNSVTVTNNAGASVTTVGESAHGIVAISSASGGLLVNEQEATGDASDPVGLVVGNNSSDSSGSASHGGNVTVTNNGFVLVGDGGGNGVNSTGILAQSIGGGGGSASGKAALFVGDKGGKGGNGGAVTVNVGATGSVHTQDDLSVGILAQSIGGGGGNGGNALGAFVAVGGRGGSGGDGGTIGLDLAGKIETDGMHSPAVIAQSIGGGGGHGGTARAVEELLSAGIGGKGGTGGDGGVVTSTLDSTGSITTAQNNSTGMILQSVGGGGGTGGAAISASGSLVFDVSFALGGDGGSGGAGKSVTGTNNGTITTGTAFTGDSVPRLDGADSFGMVAQSIGGGGGHAGGAVAKDLAAQLPDVPATLAVSVALGGSGGSGSDGGASSLTNAGTITTWGDGSGGLLAQSIGGGGGHGGDSTASSLLLAYEGWEASANVAVGGSGGEGGSADAVTVTNSTTSSAITTHGQNATGITAQSIGGGGGHAAIGNAIARDPTVSDGDTTTWTASIGVGGSGGHGGHAGYTNVTNDGAITTTGSGAEGILAQSIGGGGGAAKGGSASGSDNSITFDLVIGGTGGDGGSATTTENEGYSVNVTNEGTITTGGGDGTGIVAQSIGGGGGIGGSTDAEATIGTLSTITNVIFASGLSPHVTVGASAGGSGGGGGTGGNVLVNQDNTITTGGSRAYGILAQSISGGGGAGGSGFAASNPGLLDGYDGTLNFETDVAVGGNGGNASDGGDVTVNNAGSTSTAGYGSHGLIAQSVAGGGGIGADGTPDIAATLGLGIGVNRSAGGTESASGGAVTVTQTGSLTTAGGDASGVVAQSIGGGGGIASAGSVPTFTSADFTAGVLPLHMDVTLGFHQDNSASSNGGQVGVTASGLTQTTGDWSHGIVAQSIGAGGGKGGTITGTNSNASSNLDVQLGASKGTGHGGEVDITLTGGAISVGATGPDATGYGAMGVVAQSIGAGGGLFADGSSAADGTITLGTASGDAKGSGGVVTLTGAGGTITTRGDSGHGVVLQSIGGGGGIAGTGSTQTYQGTGTGFELSLFLGSDDGEGSGGSVTFDSGVSVQTHGDSAIGLVAQSIGGGGGLVATQENVLTDVIGMTNASHSYDDYGGGTVSVTIPSGSSIQTSGDASHGIVAQSIGGGGGILNPEAGYAPSTSSGNEAAALGYGGDVGVEVDGAVNVTGEWAIGVLAQSVAGGGGVFLSGIGSTGGHNASGWEQTNGGNGDVLVTQGSGGVITATGAFSTGIFAQNVSAGAHGLGKVEVTLGGSVTGGADPNPDNPDGGFGVWIDGGTGSNTLTVESGGSVTALSGNALNYTGGAKLAVTNDGTIDGSLLLNADSTVINNGTLKNATTIIGDVTNNGTLSLLDDTSIDLTVTGDYTQGLDGVLDLGITSLDDYNAVEVTGTALYSGLLYLAFSADYHPSVGETFQFLNATNASYGFSDVQITGLSSGVIWQAFPTGTSYSLQIIAVPEPVEWGFVLGGGLALLALRRRRSVDSGNRG